MAETYVLARPALGKRGLQALPQQKLRSLRRHRLSKPSPSSRHAIRAGCDDRRARRRRAASAHILFVEKMDTQAGILGRDVLSQWKHIGFTPTPKVLHSAWLVEITL
jgi:hypothetical protein